VQRLVAKERGLSVERRGFNGVHNDENGETTLSSILHHRRPIVEQTVAVCCRANRQCRDLDGTHTVGGLQQVADEPLRGSEQSPQTAASHIGTDPLNTLHRRHLRSFVQGQTDTSHSHQIPPLYTATTRRTVTDRARK